MIRRLIMSCGSGKTVLSAVTIFLLTFTCGCASDRTTPKSSLDEKWSALAEQSQGHSPSPRPHGESVTEFQSPRIASARTLPTGAVSLKMRNADVKNILRALARISGVSIVVSDAARGVMTIDFAAVPWDQVFRTVLNATGLVYTWEGDILHVMTVDEMEKALKVGAVQEKKIAQDMAEKMVEPFSTVIVSIDYADAKSLKESLEEFLTKDKNGKPRGSIRVDEHNNALVLQAIREDIDTMLPVIQKIDKPTPQILIKANIVETSKDIARSLGIQWGGLRNVPTQGNTLTIYPGMDSSTGAQRPFNVDFPVSPGAIQAAGGTAALGLKYVTTSNNNLLELQLQALQNDGKLNIISSPSIITLDNQKAFTESGERVPYVSVATGVGNVGTTQQVQFIDAVLRLEIIPHVIDGKNLKMKVIVKKDEVDTSRSVQGNPFITKKNTETVLIVKDGETVVISGLTKVTDSSTDTGVPWLKDIPLLGWLFKSHSTDNNMQDVLIFITPTILPAQGAEAAAGEMGQPAR
jgi:type IV pilus assembly protein PilQ